MNKLLIFLMIIVIQSFHQAECAESDDEVTASKVQIEKPNSKAISRKWSCNEEGCDGELYATKGKYEAHLLSVHYICPICKLSFPGVSRDQEVLKQLAQHIVNDCRKKVVYVCNQDLKKRGKCIFITLLKDRAEQHASSHLKNTGNPIDIEEYAIRLGECNESVACPIESCGKKIVKLRFNNHKLTKHKICPWCEDLSEYRSIEEIEVHCQKNHNEKNLYVCQKCKGFLSLDRTKFLSHQAVCVGPKVIKRTREVLKKISPTKGKFKCWAQDCDEAYADKGRNDHHIVCEHHMCPECGFRADNFDRKEIEKVAIQLLTPTASNNPGHISKFTRRSVYLCDQVKNDGGDCLYIGLRADDAKKHAQTHSIDLSVEPYKIPKEIKIKREVLACPFTQICQRAQLGDPFERRAKLIEHIVRSHVECPFGESFGYCQKWNEVKKRVAEDLKRKLNCLEASDEVLKPKFRLALEKHVLECHKESCKYIKACSRCENTISTAEGDFKNHSCSVKNRSKLANHGDSIKEVIVETTKRNTNSSKEEGVQVAKSKSSLRSKSHAVELPSWCWVLNCEKEFQDIKKLKDHLAHDHAVCMECFEKYAVTERIKNHKKSLAHKTEHDRVLKRKGEHSEDLFLFGKKEVCVMCAISYCFTNADQLKDHIKSGHKNKAYHVEHELGFDDRSSDSSGYCQGKDLIDSEPEDDFEHSYKEYSSFDEELKDWKYETPQFDEDSTFRVVHEYTDSDKSLMNFSDLESSIEEDIFLSCWMKKWDVEFTSDEKTKLKLKKKYCCAALEGEETIIEHFQSMHNICFECMKSKAFFSRAEELIKHENRSHKGKVVRASKCLTYGEKVVCLLCVTKHCQYGKPEELELHIEQNHHVN